MIAAAVGLLIASFAVGSVFYGFSHDRTPGARKTTSTIRQRADDQQTPNFIPVTELDPTATVGTTMTPSPIPDPDHRPLVPGDSTGMTSEQYSQVLQQSQQPPAAAAGVTTDPRLITTTTIPQQEPQVPQSSAPRPPSNETTVLADRDEPRRHVKRTSPEPEYQPVPAIEERIRKPGEARFVLTVGANGKVKEIEVVNAIPGQTSRLIAAIQTWRFKPATENGRPVEGTFDVDLFFNPRNGR